MENVPLGPLANRVRLPGAPAWTGGTLDGAPYASATPMPSFRIVGVTLLLASFGCGSGSAASEDGGWSNGPTADSAPTPDAESFDARASSMGCIKGSVDIVLRAAPGGTSLYCLSAPGSCGTTYWLSIVTADGGQALGMDHNCVADCTSCQPVSVPCGGACAAALLLGDGGTHATWDGTYVQSGECGAKKLTCVNSSCAPAGSYIARMCGYAATPNEATPVGPWCTSSSSTPTCADVPFFWPPPSGNARVQGEIGAGGSDAGSD